MNLYERTYTRQWKAWNRAVMATEAELLEVYEMTYRGLEVDILSTATLGEFDRVAQMKYMRKMLRDRMYELSNNVNGIITTGIENQIVGVLDDQLKALGAYITDHRWNIPYMPMAGEMSSLQLGTFEYMMRNPAERIPLSKRIWRLHQESYKEMTRILNRGLLEGKPAVQIARDCEIFLADPRGSARSAGVVKALRTRAQKAKAAGDAERARRLFTKARGLEVKLPKMPQGIYRSPLKNALRMTRSEATRAQFVTTVQYAQEREWITRIKWVLSAGHPRIDICDDLAGEYEKGNVPFPPHPHCICHLEYVLSPTITGKDLPPAQMPPVYFDIIGKKRITDPVLLAQRQVALKGLEKIVAKPKPYVRPEKAAEDWARKNIQGLNKVNYADIDIDMANEINKAVAEISQKYHVNVPVIAPSRETFPGRVQNAPMQASERGIGFKPEYWTGKGKRNFMVWLSANPSGTSGVAGANIRGYVMHELGHVLQQRGRFASGELMGWQASEKLMKPIINQYRHKLGRDGVVRELGEYAWSGGLRERQWAETWCEAFSAYSVDKTQLSADALQMVEKILTTLGFGG